MLSNLSERMIYMLFCSTLSNISVELLMGDRRICVIRRLSFKIINTDVVTVSHAADYGLQYDRLLHMIKT